MLSEEERRLALARMDADQSTATEGRKEKTTLALILRACSLNVSVAILVNLPGRLNITVLLDDPVLDMFWS